MLLLDGHVDQTKNPTVQTKASYTVSMRPDKPTAETLKNDFNGVPQKTLCFLNRPVERSEPGFRYYL